MGNSARIFRVRLFAVRDQARPDLTQALELNPDLLGAGTALASP